MIKAYRILTTILYPFLFLFLFFRTIIKKEDPERFKEKIFISRFNIKKKGESKLIWFHAASIGEKRVEALRLADIFRASVVDSTLKSFVFQITGTPEKIDAFAELMEPLGLNEVARTGIAAISRGK